MPGTITKGKLGKQDAGLWSGTSARTFSRPTSTGGTQDMRLLDWVGVDVHQVYGSGTSATDGTIQRAIDAAGSNKVTLWLAPVTWAIDNNLTIPSNICLAIPAGASLVVASGKTLTINGPVLAPAIQVFSGSGTTTFAGPGLSYGSWSGGSNSFIFDGTTVSALGWSLIGASTAAAARTVLGAASEGGYIQPLEDVSLDDDYPASNTVVGSTAYRKANAVKMEDASIQGITGFVNLPSSSTDYQLVIECAQSTSLTGKYIALKVEMYAIAEGADAAANSADVTTTQAIACRADTNVLIVENTNFRITSASLSADNQMVRVGIWRIGDSSSPTDDHTGDTYLYRAYMKAVA